MTKPDYESCRVCGHAAPYKFSNSVIGNIVRYFDCQHCGYVQTERPYWLEQAYSKAINVEDTGIVWRNSLNTGRVLMTLLALNKLRGRVIDYAGGLGILVRMLRDAGVDAYWSDKYCDNAVARGFEADDGTYDLLTAFEVFEHLEHPLPELENMLARAPAVLISTELIRGRGTPAPEWWYFQPEHGQHIGFFRQSTLAHMAERLNCNYATDGLSLHLFHSSKIPWSWRPLQRLRIFAPLLTRFALQSKVVTDFEALRRRH